MAEPEQVSHGWMRGKTFRLKVDCPRAEVYKGYWEGGEPQMRSTPYKKGDMVKVVMVSRFGDCGITTDLSRETGYAARVDPEHLEVVEHHEDCSCAADHIGPCRNPRVGSAE